MSTLIDPPGFSYFPSFLKPEEEKSLLYHMQGLEWQSVKMYGVTAKRQVIHYGLDYHFQTRSVTPTMPPPQFLDWIIEKARPLLRVEESELLEVLLSFYPIGAGIGWHKDARMFDKILGISLANASLMKFRRKENPREVIKYTLAPCSAYILSDSIRENWEHCIPSVKMPRYSITVRTLRQIIKP